MAGASFELESAKVQTTINQVVNALDGPARLFHVIIEYLHRDHRACFKSQVLSDGKALQCSPHSWG